MTKCEIFWQWFVENNEELTMLNEFDEPKQNKILDALQEQLSRYCEGLTFEMSEPSQTGRRVIISAEGDMDLFENVLELTDNAPDLDWWEFIPFKQPRGAGIKVRFDKYFFDSNKLYFQQVENEEEPDLLGVRIAVENCNPDDEDQLVGVYTLLEDMIGEFDCATLISYFDICPIPKEPFKEGFQPLNEFPEFVEWFKDQREKE